MILNLARIQEEIILMLKRKLQKMKIKLMEQKIILRKKRILRMRFSRKFQQEKILLQIQSQKKKVIVENTAAGIRLTMQNLNFKPDSAELLPGENERLDQIAQVLKEVPDQMFLVEGHTASVGYEKGEMKLSVERANSVANALIQRGISREKFICKGSGGTKPIADNSTQEGKAKNRRVEITILE